jgi:hypothetical protein
MANGTVQRANRVSHFLGSKTLRVYTTAAHVITNIKNKIQTKMHQQHGNGNGDIMQRK